MMLPDNTNATAGNGGESQHIKAAGLPLMIPQTIANTFGLEDRHAAYCAGYDDGMNHKFGLEVAEAAQAALHDQARAALGMAKAHAEAKGPSWAAFFGESDD
ncbi:MAG: hypothetical protein HHJ13_17635 [Phycicoccus sp.]|nr:hypothetical protein [Phycicoccus sp.]